MTAWKGTLTAISVPDRLGDPLHESGPSTEIWARETSDQRLLADCIPFYEFKSWSVIPFVSTVRTNRCHWTTR